MTTRTDQAQAQSSTDRIERRYELHAPRARVWRAITDANQFSAWFGVKLDGAFAPRTTIRGRNTSPGFDHMLMEFQVEQIDPERYFSYRWHPYPFDPNADYSAEPTTLVEFHLEEIASGTAVTIVESGFDQIPLARRTEAYRMHDQGWTGQANKLARYVA